MYINYPKEFKTIFLLYLMRYKKKRNEVKPGFGTSRRLVPHEAESEGFHRFLEYLVE